MLAGRVTDNGWVLVCGAGVKSLLVIVWGTLRGNARARATLPGHTTKRSRRIGWKKRWATTQPR